MAEEKGWARGRKGDPELQRVLLEQHWQEARSFDRQKMWITGLFFAGFAYVAAGDPARRALYPFMGVAGLVAFLAVMKLQYLSEIHMAKAQVYLSGRRRGRIFGFHIKKGSQRDGEQST